MKTSTRLFTAVAVLVQLVAAAEVSNLIGVSLRKGTSIQRRQTDAISINPDDIPRTCMPRCMTFVDAYNKCTTTPTTTCLCSSSVIDSYASCLSCYYGPIDVSTAQAGVDKLVDTCIASGESVTSVTIPGAGSAVGSGSTSTSFITPGATDTTHIFLSSDPTTTTTDSASPVAESPTDISGGPGSSPDTSAGSTTSSAQTTHTPTTSASPSAQSSGAGGPAAGGGEGDGALTLQAGAFVGFLGFVVTGVLLL